MSIGVFTTNLEPHRLRGKTMPAIAAYAERLGAKLTIIQERRYPDYGDFYEKFQIHKLGAANDWNIFIDWDVLVSPGLIDMTNQCPQNAVGHWGEYGASSWFVMDAVFKEDVENRVEAGPIDSVCDKCGQPVASQPIISVTRPRDIAFNDSILCVPAFCHDVWAPCEHAADVALMHCRRQKWIGEWNLARNLARNRFNVWQFRSPARMSGAQSDDDCFLRIDCQRCGTPMTESQTLAKATEYERR